MNKYLVLLLVGMMVVMTGCYGTKKNVDEHVRIDKSASTTVQLVSCKLDESKSDTMVVLIELASMSDDESLMYEYRVEWFTETGMLYERPILSRHVISIPRGEHVYLKMVAPSEDIKDYRFQLRRIIK